MNTPVGKIEEKQLIAACIAGNRDAAEALVRKFSDHVYAAVQQTLRNRNVSFVREDCEDFHNIVFLKLFENRFKKLKQFKGKNGCSLKTWLRVVVVRLILNHLREKKIGSLGYQRKVMAYHHLPEFFDERPSALHQIEQTDRIKQLQQALQEISTRDRLFFKLHMEKALSIQEVAKIMKISVPNSYTIKHRVIQRLRSFMSTNEVV